MAGVSSRGSPAKSPRSYQNTPQAARTTQRIDGSTATEKMDAFGTPLIEQMYDQSKVKHLPGKGRKGNPEFVDWGTKLYQLELELSYKTNEIAVLQKKLQKFANELYPGGDSNKKSVVQALRSQNDSLRKRITTKERQLKWEQKRCKGLEFELSAEKRNSKKLRKHQTTNHKAVQTSPINHEAVQVGPNLIKPRSRTVMTQCSPTVVKVTNTTKVTSDEAGPGESKTSIAWRTAEHNTLRDRNVRTSTSSTVISRSPNASSSNFQPRRNQRTKTDYVTVENKVRVEVVPKETTRSSASTTAISTAKHASSVPTHRIPSKPGVQFATAMTIKENPATSQEDRDPLEMSITQEFDKENSVKTMVQSNRDFEIKQKPLLLSQDGQVVAGIEHVSLPERLNSANNDNDSGRGSFVSDRGSPSSLCRGNQSRNGKVSYKQILDGASPSSSFSTSTIFERNVPDLMTPQSYSQRRKADARFNTTAWEIYNRGSPNSSPGAMVPYYLFRRSNEHDLRNKQREKPIFVHVSEIMMQQ